MAKFEVTTEGLKSDMDALNRLLLDRKLLRLRTKLHIRQAQEKGLDTTDLDMLLAYYEKAIESSDECYQAAKRDYEKHLARINSLPFRAKKQVTKTVGAVKSWFSKKPAQAPATA